MNQNFLLHMDPDILVYADALVAMELAYIRRIYEDRIYFKLQNWIFRYKKPPLVDRFYILWNAGMYSIT